MFRLSLDALLVLDAIARRGSFAAAAEEVHRTTSTLSYTVQKLERDLGVHLFDRSGHRAELTEHGRLLLAEGRELLDQALALERRMRTLGRGWEPTLRLCVNELVGLAPLYALVRAFQDEGHPTRLRIDTGVLGGPWEALLAQRADLAICEVPAAPPTEIAHTEDEIGALNRITPASTLAVLSRVSSGKTYDLSVEYYVGMPSYYFLGQPRYQIWNVHTPQGTIVDDPTGIGPEANARVTYSAQAISMYVHTGTHIDALAHFGLQGRIWNGYSAEEHLGDRGWRRGGIENFPPIIARGVLLDVAAFKQVEVLPPSYGISVDDLRGAARRAGVKVERGDVVMVRTGRMRLFDQPEAYMTDTPGLVRESAEWLAEQGAIVIGVDNISTDAWPSAEPENWIPVHSSMLSEHGVPIMQNVYLEELAADRVHQFAWIGAPLKLRGADGAPMRPIALPIR